MPVDHPPRKLGTQSTLVFNQKGKISTSFGIVYFIAFFDVSTEDTSHASFSFLRIKSFHIKQTLGWLTAARGLCRTIATKNPEHTGLWDKSSAHTDRVLVVARTFCLDDKDFLNSRCKYTTEYRKLFFSLTEIGNFGYVYNRNLVN